MNNFLERFNEAFGDRGNHTVWLKTYPRGTGVGRSYKEQSRQITRGVTSRRATDPGLKRLIDEFF